jgi:hypothetical protein
VRAILVTGLLIVLLFGGERVSIAEAAGTSFALIVGLQGTF